MKMEGILSDAIFGNVMYWADVINTSDSLYGTYIFEISPGLARVTEVDEKGNIIGDYSESSGIGEFDFSEQNISRLQTILSMGLGRCDAIDKIGVGVY